MPRERLSAFFDAVLAIIMTILVLELEKPQVLSLQGLLGIAPNLFAYTLSFAWLGTMWIGIHRTWHDVEVISDETVVSMIILLFFASFFPYTTSIVAMNFNNLFAQLLYGFISIMVTICVRWNYKSLSKADKNNIKLKQDIVSYVNSLYIDIIIKAFGILIAILFYPPMVMYSILLAALWIMSKRFNLIKRSTIR
jgi:terC family integral membrane protein